MSFRSILESRPYSRAILLTLWVVQVTLNLALVISSIVLLVLNSRWRRNYRGGLQTWHTSSLSNGYSGDDGYYRPQPGYGSSISVRLAFDSLSLLAILTQSALYFRKKLSPFALLQINVVLGCYWTGIFILHMCAIGGVASGGAITSVLDFGFSTALVPFVWTSPAYAAFAFGREHSGIFLAESDGARADYTPEEHQRAAE